MKKALKKTFIILLSVLLVLTVFALTFYYIATADAILDENKLVNLNSSIEIYDKNGALIEEYSGDKSVTDINEIPEHTLNAFIAIEDKRFYSHHGVDVKGLFRAFFNNIITFSFKEGASTITQQLIKNTHLNGEKTLKRKLSEIKLATEIEGKYSKKEILEKYLNTIYFGESCYGITSAAQRYFGISPKDLSVNQSAALAGIIKAPSVYSPTRSAENFNARKNVVLKEMLSQNYISEAEYDQCVKTPLSVMEEQDAKDNSYLKLVKKRLTEIVDFKNAYNLKLKVYTHYDRELQGVLENSANSYDLSCDKCAVILDKNNYISAYYSTCGDIYRPMGSVIKPLLVFAPAIDMGYVYPCSPILDEKINVNGYAPSNYNDVYYGYVSVKTALAKSLNSCAVKLFNDCGIDNCLSYIKKTDIPITSNDENLSLSLGASEKGANIYQIAGAYGAFLNKGEYISPSMISRVQTENGIVLYNETPKKTRIYREDTAFLINDMLKETVRSGTAKTLSSLNLPLSAKTGTVGNDKGNTDAYSVSYNGNYVAAFWIGNKDNSLMPNSHTGGNFPTKMAKTFWQTLKDKNYSSEDTFSTDSVIIKDIDKIAYDLEHKVELANENFPKRYVLSEKFSKSHLPTASSTRFSIPKTDDANISVHAGRVNIKISLPEYYEFKIYKEYDGLKFMIYDSGKNRALSDKTDFTDRNVFPDKTYLYSVIPYYNGNNGTIFGEEFFFEKIKTPPYYIDDDWWKDLFS